MILHASTPQDHEQVSTLEHLLMILLLSDHYLQLLSLFRTHSLVIPNTLTPGTAFMPPASTRSLPPLS